MKINRLYTVILLFLDPMLVFSMGMGEIKVESFLNQPFNAEIPLIDVGGVPLSGIKVSLASVEEFKRIGLDRDAILDVLQFQAVNDKHGRAIIKISSIERITEPYLDILVDLAWANGQLYRNYPVLLDPPGYKLVIPGPVMGNSSGSYVMKGSGVIERPVYTQINKPVLAKQSRNQATYGPTLANESIWQIAQRYSTPDTTLQQIILAIVGTNSQAFTQGNLNGLKAGERLKIPSTEEVLRVPADLAKEEVDAHDAAWKSKEEIKHVLLPPYIDGVAGSTQFNQDTSLISVVAEVPTLATVVETETDKDRLLPISYLPPLESKASFTTLDPVTQESELIKAQVKELQASNIQLQKSIAEQNKAFKELLETQKNKPIAAPINSEITSNQSSNVWLYLLLIALTGGAGLWYWMRVKYREEELIAIPESTDVPTSETQTLEPPMSKNELQEPSLAPEPMSPSTEEKAPILSALETPALVTEPELTSTLSANEEEEPPLNLSSNNKPPREETTPTQGNEPDDFTLDFEPGLDKFIPAEKIETANHDDEASIDFDMNHESLKPTKLVKSKSALETLLALAKTYIAMEDFETAKQSLEEVLEAGNKNQKQEAQKLLDAIKNK